LRKGGRGEDGHGEHGGEEITEKKAEKKLDGSRDERWGMGSRGRNILPILNPHLFLSSPLLSSLSLRDLRGESSSSVKRSGT
jgi:hypothetical protein